MMQHVMPVDGKAAVKTDGSPIVKKTAVDTSVPFYANQITNGGLTLWKAPKKPKTDEVK